MKLIPLKSKRIQSGDSLVSAVLQALEQNDSRLESGDILVVASKIVSYSQGRLVACESDDQLRQLVKAEADQLFEGEAISLTIKNKILIPNAGIDRSNVPKGKAILWPQKSFEAAKNLRHALISEYNLKNLGLIISDSHCQPLRLGTTGIAIGWAGFEGVVDERGAEDLFGQKMQYTQLAVADNLASASTVLMGETNASIPFVIIRNFDARFTDRAFSEEDYFIPPNECLYRSLYSL